MTDTTTGHECHPDIYARHWRFILAQVEPNSNEFTLNPGHAYWIAWAEIEDCLDCLKGALEIALHQCAADFELKAGSRAKAADAAAEEIGRLIPQ